MLSTVTTSSFIRRCKIYGHCAIILKCVEIAAASQGMLEGLDGLQTDLVTPEHIAEELTAVGLISASLLAVHRLLDLTPFKVRPLKSAECLV